MPAPRIRPPLLPEASSPTGLLSAPSAGDVSVACVTPTMRTAEPLSKVACSADTAASFYTVNQGDRISSSDLETTATRPETNEVSRPQGNKVCPSCGDRYPDHFNVCPRDAAPLRWKPADEDPYLGMTLAETYRVVRVLGEGGMAKVYEVHHTRLSHRRFAMKMLHPEYARYGDIVTRFQREAEAVSKITNPHVIDVFDVGRTPDGRPYLICEFLQGEELGVVIKRVGKIDLPRAISIIRQACRALAAAHQHDVVHRDMKPENMFLVGGLSQPHIKVLDFGISKIGGHEGTHLTRTGMIMGTPAYMAPEQARGEQVDQRADVYSTGAILYRLLTGRTPFAIEDTGAAITAVLTEHPPRPRSLAAEIPEALELVIERAMAKSPRDRYASITELDGALAPFDIPPSSWPSAYLFSPSLDREGLTASGPAAGSNSGGGTSSTLAHTSPALARATRDAQLARPQLVALSAVAGLALVLSVTDAIAGLVLLIARQETLGVLNATLLLLGVVAAFLTPFMLFIRHLARAVWGSTVRAIRVSNQLRTATLAALATYGGVALLIRFLECILRQTPREVAWPGWSIFLLLGASIAACSAMVLHRLGEPKE